MRKPALPAYADRVRRDDPDRFFAALLAPAPHRAALLLLAAFDLEIAGAARRRTEMAGPYPALIRLQWWRDLVEGRTSDARHELAGPLQDALQAARMDPADLLTMLDGREAEAEGVPDWPAWREAVLKGAGGGAVAAARVLGVDDPERLAPLGAAREVALMRPGTAFLPAGESVDALPAAAAHLFAEVPPPCLPRAQRAVLLPLELARRGTYPPARARGLGGQWTMLRLWLFG